MIEEYLTLAERIKKELKYLQKVVERADRAIQAARRRPEDQDLYLDSAVLNLHDYYAGATIDRGNLGSQRQILTLILSGRRGVVAPEIIPTVT